MGNIECRNYGADPINNNHCPKDRHAMFSVCLRKKLAWGFSAPSSKEDTHKVSLTISDRYQGISARVWKVLNGLKQPLSPELSRRKSFVRSHDSSTFKRNSSIAVL